MKFKPGKTPVEVRTNSKGEYITHQGWRYFLVNGVETSLVPGFFDQFTHVFKVDGNRYGATLLCVSVSWHGKYACKSIVVTDIEDPVKIEGLAYIFDNLQ